jgi:hypothetical protein
MFDKNCYALFFTHPFDHKFVAFVGCDDVPHIFWDKIHFQSFLKSQQVNVVFSYGLQDVIHSLDTIPADVLYYNVQTGIQLLDGNPRDNYKSGKEPWAIKTMVDKYIVDDDVRSWLGSLLNNKVAGLHQWISGKQMLINSLFAAFRSATNCLLEKLNQNDEFVRYCDIEIPIYNIFLKIEQEGICVSNDAIYSLVTDLSNEYYQSLKVIELKYGFVRRIHSSLQADDVKDIISDDHYEVLSKERSLWDGISSLPEENDFLLHLINAYQDNLDRNELYKYHVEENDKIYPRFNTMGTVTGRITVEKPGIQRLKKIYRRIFVPRNGMRFVYADYSQFEPGILAELSGNETLKSLYNDGDIYTNLSKVIFGNCEGREIAKKIFLSFCYGMSNENIIKSAVQYGNNPSVEESVKTFFEQFSDLEDWKKKLIDDVKSVGFVSSLCGNRRYIKVKGETTASENRWIPNHIIQSTASLIFKTALISISQQISSARLLIPMHDAILLEINPHDEDTIKRQVAKIMEGSFRQFCPSVVPRIKFQEF